MLFGTTLVEVELDKDNRMGKTPMMAWVWASVATLLVHQILLDEEPVIRMLGLVTSLFLTTKVISLFYQFNQVRKGNLLWLLFWPGMSAQAFRRRRAPNTILFLKELKKGISFTIAGLMVLWIARNLDFPNVIKVPLVWAGLCFVVHFGIFSLIRGLYFIGGWRTNRLFDLPWKSKSLSEFWSKRWNGAYIEMLALMCLRPLKTMIGGRWAVVVCFLISGLLHEAAISLPVMSGFGGPFLYFCLQAIGVQIPMDRWPRLFRIAVTWLFVLAPLPLLFHSEFTFRVLFPLTGVSL